MHPVLGTMMPEICEAPHLPVFPFIYHCAPYLMGWDVFITFPEYYEYVKIMQLSFFNADPLPLRPENYSPETQLQS